MAGIDVGGHGKKRNVTHDVPLIPFIDFLLCLVMFLLVTAVWSHMARLRADAQVPGPAGPEQHVPEKELHVDMTRGQSFQLSWRQGSTVVETIDVLRKPITKGTTVTFPELSSAIAKAWQTSGAHRSANDRKFDRAVLHSNNSDAFAEVSAVLDAMSEPKREFSFGSATERVSAFQVAFAVN